MKIDLSRNLKQQSYFLDIIRAAKGQSDLRFFAFGGSIRGGKTFVTLFSLIVLARMYPGSRWHVIRKDLPTLKATTIPSFEKLAPAGVKIHRDPGNYRAEFENGSQIFFKAESLTQDPELKDYLGLETNGIFLEQAEELSERMHEKAKERTGSWYIDPMPPGFIFYTFNPTDNWVRTTFYEPFKRGELKSPYYYQEALPSDNPFVTEDQWAAWGEMDDITYRMMVKGDWDARRTDNQFYYAFSRAVHVQETTVDTSLPVHLSFDQNVLPYITLTCWQIQYTGDMATAVQFDEFCLEHPRNNTEALCTAFMEKYGQLVKHVYLYGDASGNKRDTRANETDYAIAKRVLRPLLNNVSDRTLTSNPDVIRRREWINNIFAGKYGIRVVIDPACKFTVSDLINTPTDASGHKLKKKIRGANGQMYEEFGHCFTGDTLVRTDLGEKQIRHIVPGDYVLTRSGYRKVLNKFNNGIRLVGRYFINGVGVSCTPDHRFYTKNRGFIEAGELQLNDICCIFDSLNNQICNQRLLFTTGLGLSVTQNQKQGKQEYITADGQRTLRAAKLKSAFIGMCMNSTTAKFLKAITSTIKTAIRSIIQSKTWSVSPVRPTQNTITTNRVPNTKKRSTGYYLNLRNRKPQSGTSQTKAENGTGTMLEHQFTEMPGAFAVSSADLISQQPLRQKLSFVHGDAKTGTTQGSTEKTGNTLQNFRVPYAVRSLAGTNTQNQKHAPGNAVRYWLEEVFDIEVEGAHEYFANGILVHNCSDTFDYLTTTVFRKEFDRYCNNRFSVSQ